jgi:hypothetical protein
VPGAMGMTGDHWPEAQRWKEVPSMQFQAPSLVQGPELAPVEGVEGPEPEPEPVLGAGAGAAVVVAGGATEAVLVAVSKVVASEMVRKTPLEDCEQEPERGVLG